MANGDDNYLDPQEGTTYAPATQSQDQYPPGTSTALGLGQNDPLRQWAGQMTPDQLKTFSDLHAQGDFEGAKQHLIDNGIPPPDHHYDQSGQPFYPTDAMGQTRMTSTGNIQTTPQQQAVQAVQQATGGGQQPQAPTAAPAPRRTRALGFTGDPGGSFGSEAPDQTISPGQAGAAIKPYITPPPITPQRAPAAPEKEVNPSPVTGTPTPRERPMGAPKRTTYETDDGGKVTIDHPPAEGGGEKVPTPKPRPKEADKSWMQTTGEGLSDLSKSLEGVKAPPRPPAPSVSVSSVAPRGPLSVNHPQLQNLLAMIGQNPSAAQGLIQRLSGLRGF